MSDSKSNIRIKSNVFLRSSESLSDGDHPERDAAFAAQILDESALMKLKKRADENGVDIAFSDLQKRILNGERNIRAAEQFIQIAESASKEILSVQMTEESGQTAESDTGAELLAKNDAGAEILSVQMTEELGLPAESGEGSELLSVQMADDPDQTAESVETAESLPAQTAKEEEQAAESAEAAEILPVQTAKEEEQAAESPDPAAGSSEKPKPEGLTFGELTEHGFGDEKTLIVCSDGGYAKYVSFLLHQNNIPHTLMNDASAQAPMRHFADVLWDCHDKVINRDNFVKRFTARCSSDAACADECFDALCGFAGSAPSDGLDIGALAKSIMDGRVPDSVFGERLSIVTVAAADDVNDGQYGRAYVLENGADSALTERELAAEKLLLTIADCPALVSGGAGGFAALDGAGNAAIGLDKDDTDCLSFIGGSVGDAVRKQAYISQNVKCGDEIRLELNGGVYDVVHNGMVIAKTAEVFSERVLSEFGGKKYFDQLPQSLGGLIVTDVTAVVSCRSAEEFGETVPSQFRDRNFWLGVEISGFAAQI